MALRMADVLPRCCPAARIPGTDSLSISAATRSIFGHLAASKLPDRDPLSLRRFGRCR
jgi:hypothetical protein